MTQAEKYREMANELNRLADDDNIYSVPIDNEQIKNIANTMKSFSLKKDEALRVIDIMREKTSEDKATHESKLIDE